MKWFFRRESEDEDYKFELFDLVIVVIVVMLIAIVIFAIDVLF